MAVYQVPKIITENLVFYYDMFNQKSWKGKPTTNLISNSVPISTDNFSAHGGTATLIYDNVNKALKWTLTSYSDWGAFINIFPEFHETLDTNLQYSISFKWKTENINVPDNSYSYQLVKTTGENPACDHVSLLNNSILKDGWYEFKHTFTPANTGENAFNRVILENKGTNVSIFYIKNIQFEINSFVTPFVNGTRENTEGLLDLTGNNIITLNDLTYNSNNSFSFNGDTNFISLPNDLGYIDEVSAFSVFKRNGNSKGNYHIIFGPLNLEISIPEDSGQLRTGIYTTERFVSNHGEINLNDGNFYYIGFTFKNNNKVSFINGLSVGEQETSGSLSYNFSNRTMGKFGISSTYYLNGDILLAQIYNKALTPTEVKQNYNAIKGRFI